MFIVIIRIIINN